MTVPAVIDPNKWTAGWLWLMGAVVFFIGLVFTTGELSAKFDQVVAHVELVEKKVDGALRNQTEQHDEIGKVEGQVAAANQGIIDIKAEQKEVKGNLGAEHDRTSSALTGSQRLAEDLAAGRAVNLPRIDLLERVQSTQATTLGILGQKLDDLLDTVREVKQITKSHDATIQKTGDDAAATRAVVAPKDPRGH